MISQEVVTSYIAFLEGMTPESLERFSEVFAADARFCDPFNDVRGIDSVRRVFEQMFEQLEDHGFKVLDHAAAGNRAYLNWEFRCTRRGKSQGFVIEGMSTVDFNEDGKAIAHIDHYDAASQVYESIPLLGAVLRVLRRRISAE